METQVSNLEMSKSDQTKYKHTWHTGKLNTDAWMGYQTGLSLWHVAKEMPGR